MLCMLSSIKQCVSFCVHALQEHVLRWTKPSMTSLVLGTLADMTRGKSELLAENALLRQQLIILRRQVKRPTERRVDFFWCSSPGWSEPGNRPFSLSSQRRYYAGIVSSSSCSGSASQKYARENQGFRPRRLP